MSTERDKKEDKTMANTNDARRAHDVLDGLSAGRILSKENEQLLRSFLPEPPAQMSLEALRQDVHDVWAGVHGNEWPDDMYCDLETWLDALHTELKGLKDTPAAVPALPAGMRIADHEQYGRVITSPKPNRDGIYDLLVPRPEFETGADWEYAHECELTFIDAAPAAPAHPEFLETEADYRDAPEGTIVACEDSPPWHKFDSAWLSTAAYEDNSAESMSGIIREVLRWSWGNE